MNFSTREDIDAPAAVVFAMLSDFETYERLAVRRGVDIARLGDHGTPHVGQTWEAQFSFRGKERTSRVQLTRFDPPTEMMFEGRSGGLSTTLGIDLLALSATRTRIAVRFEITPRTIPARLFVRSMRLARANLNKRFRLRVADFARDIEERHGRVA